jgi:2-polyprenyl-3-methyl-5-hydroxy-6-metoxy-1,4-benzoquinol methylase
VSRCCSAAGYRAVFDERQARRDARRYRRKGLDRASRRMLDYLRARGLDGLTALEIGGGVGAIQIELLKEGAARTTSVELSSAYEEEAAGLLDEAGLAGRSDRRILDFAAEAGSVEPADVVVMHRVVCCYPDPEALVGAAAAHTGRRLVLSFPPDNLLSRIVSTGFNVWCAVRRIEFRSYVHPVPAILGAAQERGLRPAETGRAGIWSYAALERG